MNQYAKFIVAVIGVGITTLLGLLPDHTTTLWTVLTVVSAMLTAISVYAVPNAPDEKALDQWARDHGAVPSSVPGSRDPYYGPGPA